MKERRPSTGCTSNGRRLRNNRFGKDESGGKPSRFLRDIGEIRADPAECSRPFRRKHHGAGNRNGHAKKRVKVIKPVKPVNSKVSRAFLRFRAVKKGKKGPGRAKQGHT